MQYFPYDLAYDSHRGIMALCTFGHISTATGSIVDDKEKWAFLLDMSSVQGVVLASAVSYSNAASGIPHTDVQTTIDYLEAQIVQMNNINVTQGNNITSLSNYNATQDATVAALTTRVGNTEGKNSTQDNTLSSLQTQINNLQGQVNNLPTSASIPSGTVMFFGQQYAPAGWNQVNGWSDRAIRLVDGGGGGGGFGGAYGWSSLMTFQNTGAFGITETEMPAHHHGFGAVYTTVRVSEDGPGSIQVVQNVNPYSNDVQTSDTGGSQGHLHGLDLRLAYVDTCVGQKQ